MMEVSAAVNAGKGRPIGGVLDDSAHTLEPEGGAGMTAARPFEGATGAVFGRTEF